MTDIKVTPEDVLSTSTEDTQAPGGDVSPNQPGHKDEPGAAPQPGSSPQPATTPSPQPDTTSQPAVEPTKIQAATPQPEPPKVRTDEGTPAAGQQADIELKTEAGAVAAPMDPTKIGQGEKIADEPGGPPAAYATRKVNEGIAKEKAGPVIEHVNPHYADPPCTPSQIVMVQNHILETLAERARMEQAAAAMGKQEKRHKDNQGPVAKLEERTEDAISATEAHKQAVARREEANAKSQGDEAKVKKHLDDYGDEASKLSKIKSLLSGFEEFSSLGYSLPDWWPLGKVKFYIVHMNNDARRFLSQMNRTDKAIGDQEDAQPKRQESLQEDAGTIASTKSKADDSGESLDFTKEDAEDFDKDNTAHLDEAVKLKTETGQAKTLLDAHARQKKAQAQTMAVDLQAWAQNHKKARTDAIEATKQKYLKQGYKIVEVKEL